MLSKLAVLVYGGIVDFKQREIPDFIPVSLFGISVFELILQKGPLIGERLFMLAMVIAWILVIEFFAIRGKSTAVPGGDIKLLTALAFSEGVLMFAATLIGVGVLTTTVKLFDWKHRIHSFPLCTYVAGASVLFEGLFWGLANNFFSFCI